MPNKKDIRLRCCFLFDGYSYFFDWTLAFDIDLYRSLLFISFIGDIRWTIFSVLTLLIYVHTLKTMKKYSTKPNITFIEIKTLSNYMNELLWFFSTSINKLIYNWKHILRKYFCDIDSIWFQFQLKLHHNIIWYWMRTLNYLNFLMLYIVIIKNKIKLTLLFHLTLYFANYLDL